MDITVARRRHDDEARALLTHSIFRSGSEWPTGLPQTRKPRRTIWRRRVRSRRTSGGAGWRSRLPAGARLKAIVTDKTKPMEERFAASLKLAELPRNSSPRRASATAARSTGRPRAFYRKHKLSRIALRDLGSKGLIPGLLKSSW